jgi:WLM domain-containing protein
LTAGPGLLSVAEYQTGPPTPAAQAAVLAQLRVLLEPILLAEGIAPCFTLQPGLRLRRAYGRCAWVVAGQPPLLSVRCTADNDRTRWRRTGALVGTLLHEMAHVRYRSHGPRFWGLQRRLVDRAVTAGVYDPRDRDPDERARGDEKLAGSAARSIALAARQARRERARANRAAVQSWEVGAVARVAAGRGVLAGARVRITGLGRTRLVVETADQRRYRVPPSLLAPV